MHPQLVKHLYVEEKKKKPDIKHTYLITKKLNGWYVYHDYINGVWHNARSRDGREIPSLRHYTKLLSAVHLKEDARLISEAVIPGMPFEVMNGVLNRTVGDCAALNVTFHAHDLIIPSKLHLYNTIRLQGLKCLFSTSPLGALENFKLLPVILSSAIREEWIQLAENLIEAGEEGIVLKQADGIYHPGKRNSSLMKIKQEMTAHLLCVGLERTFGDKGNSSLQLILRNKAGIEVPVRVGKLEDIARIESKDLEVIGRVIKITCMCRSNKGSYTQPRLAEKFLTAKNALDID